MSNKLLFVVNEDRFFLSHRLEIALEAKRNGFNVNIATQNTGYFELIESHGFNLHSIRLDRSSSGFLSNGITFLQIIWLFLKEKPDIVHLVTIKPVLLGGLAARLTRVPSIVAAISGLGFIFISDGIKVRIQRFIVKLLYNIVFGSHNLRVIFQNNDDLAEMIKFSKLVKKKTILIRGSGVDLSKFSPSDLPSGTPIVLLISRLLKDKGVREFVEAAKILKEKDARFILVGETDHGNPASISDYQLSKWVSSGDIESWGHQTEIADILASSHMVVLPSYREGLPKTLIEAAASGRAIVTTNVPGCRDAIISDKTGILVPVRDSMKLAKAIEKLLNNRNLCIQMGIEGRKLAERKFDINYVIKSHMQIYKELTNEKTND